MYYHLCEKIPLHHHLWDVPVAHTAQIGNAHVETFYHPTLADLRAIFLVLDRILLFQSLFLQLGRTQLLFLS